MNLFKPVVTEVAQHPNFKRVMQSPESHRGVIQAWAEDFVDRDGKFVKEFQTRFNSCFWELYVFACLKELNLPVDFRFPSPDFVLIDSSCDCCVECVVAENAQDKQAEYDVTIFSRLQNPEGPGREDVAYEASVRLANSIVSKHEHYLRYYRTKDHVVGKPLVLAIAPFEQPHFGIQRLDGITNVLYAAKIAQVEKPNGRIIRLGFFLDNHMADISAVIFSNVATYGKVIALAKDVNSIGGFFTARHGHKELNSYSLEDYAETLLDGLFILHNPFARFPLATHTFSRHGIAQFFSDGNSVVADVPHGYLLERSCMSFQPTD
jgi:hypothetical protein